MAQVAPTSAEAINALEAAEENVTNKADRDFRRASMGAGGYETHVVPTFKVTKVCTQAEMQETVFRVFLILLVLRRILNIWLKYT